MKILRFLVRSVHRSVYVKFFPSLRDSAANHLQDCKTALDLGCGRGKGSLIEVTPITYSVGVDIFEPYLKESKAKGVYSNHILADITRIEFKQDSFDAVLAFEVVEHLTKEDALQLISKMEKWARKKVVITTPNGFMFQASYDDNAYQVHKTGFSIDEFSKIGYKVYGLGGVKCLRGNGSHMKFKPWWFWWIISDITQKVTYRLPRHAAGLLCVKRLSRDV